MARDVTEQGCKLYGTKYCDMLNMPSCDVCTVNGKEEEHERVMEDLDILEGLLPQGGISDLFTAEECQLCRTEPKGARSCYALLDMAHKEPVRKKRNVIGLKVNTSIGSLVPVQLSCCSACRRRLRILEYLPIVLPLALTVIALILLSIQGISTALKQVGYYMPMIVLLAVVGIGLLVAVVLSRYLREKYAKVMYVDPLVIPKLQEMTQAGWFPLNQNKKKTARVVFLKKRMASGVGTAAPQEGTDC